MFQPLITSGQTKKLFWRTFFLIVINFGLAFLAGLVMATMLMSNKMDLATFSYAIMEVSFYIAVIVTIIGYWWLKGARVFVQKPNWTKATNIMKWALLVGCVALVFWNGLIASIAEIIDGGLPVLLPTIWGAGTAGLSEEIIFRGLLGAAFLSLLQGKKGILTKTGLYTAILFGVVHLMNVVVAEPEAVVQQIIYATCFGLALAALYFAFNRLWLPILFHFLLDFHPAVNAPVESLPWLELLIVFLPLAVMALMLLVAMDSDLKAQLQSEE